MFQLAGTECLGLFSSMRLRDRGVNQNEWVIQKTLLSSTVEVVIFSTTNCNRSSSFSFIHQINNAILTINETLRPTTELSVSSVSTDMACIHRHGLSWLAALVTRCRHELSLKLFLLLLPSLFSSSPLLKPVVPIQPFRFFLLSSTSTVKPRFMKFQIPNVMPTLSMALLVSVLTGFDCNA